jgi:hypothetical protein
MSLLTRLGGLVPGYLGFTSPKPATDNKRVDRILGPLNNPTPRTDRPRPSTDERVKRNNFAGQSVFFMPYADDTSTGDTPEIREAMRRMLRDPFVKTAWCSQVLTVLAQDFQVRPDKDDKNSRTLEQAKFVRHVLENAAEGMLGIGGAIVMNLGSDGYSLAEKVWKVENRGRYQGKLVLDALKPRDATDECRMLKDDFNRLVGVECIRTNETFPMSDFTYVRYLNTFDEPGGMAAFRAAYGAYWMRDTCRKLRAIHLEKKSAGMLVGEYEDPADKPGLEQALRQAATATWMAIPVGVRIRAEQLSTASEPDFNSFDSSLREEIITAIALAHLHILQGGTSDARGDTKVHKSVSDLGPWLLTYLIQLVINKQIIPDLIDYNYPDVTSYPRITLGGVTNQEIQEQLAIIEGAQRLGFRPSKNYYAEILTIQEADPNDAEDQLTSPNSMMGMGMGGMPGMGGGMEGMGGPGMPPDGGGGMPGEEDPFAMPEGEGDEFNLFGEKNHGPWDAFAWEAAKSRTGGVKAVGTGEHSGRTLYGKRAQLVLNPRQRRASQESKPDDQAATVERATQGDPQAREAMKRGAEGIAADSFLDVARANIKPKQLSKEIADANPGERPEVIKGVESVVHSIAGENTPVGVQSAFRRAVGAIGRMGAQLAKSVTLGLLRFAGRMIKNAAGDFWDELKGVTIPPLAYAKAYGLPVAAHIGTVAGSIGALAALAYAPPLIGTAASLMIGGGMAAGMYFGGKKVLGRISQWAGDRAERTRQDLQARGYSEYTSFGLDDWEQIKGNKWRSPGGRILSDKVYQSMKAKRGGGKPQPAPAPAPAVKPFKGNLSGYQMERLEKLYDSGRLEARNEEESRYARHLASGGERYAAGRKREAEMREMTKGPFMERQTPIRRGNAYAALGKPIRVEGVIKTHAQWIEDAIDGGYTVDPEKNRMADPADGGFYTFTRKVDLDYAVHIANSGEPISLTNANKQRALEEQKKKEEADYQARKQDRLSQAEQDRSDYRKSFRAIPDYSPPVASIRPLVKMLKEGTYTLSTYLGTGWVTDKRIMLRPLPKEREKLRSEALARKSDNEANGNYMQNPLPIDNIIPKPSDVGSEAKIIAVNTPTNFTGNEHLLVESTNGRQRVRALLDAKYVGQVMSRYPNAKLFFNKDNTNNRRPIIFKVGDELVALLSILDNGATDQIEVANA